VEFEDLTWVNSRPYTLEELKGKVVLIEFWNRFCTRCQRLHPRMLEYHNKYSGQGLVILALHVPAIPEDKDPVFFKGIVNEMNIKHPVALDSNYQNWFNYGVEYTGTIFLIDKKGKVRYFIGIGTYDTLEDRIIELLAE
jgi:thiol-disulfide isomerase/thioredoxin